jgi:FAD/FMN-containing dehydrogenase
VSAKTLPPAPATPVDDALADAVIAAATAETTIPKKKATKKPQLSSSKKRPTISGKKAPSRATKNARRSKSDHHAHDHTHHEVRPVLRQLKPGERINLKRDPLGHLLVEKLLREAGFRGTVSSDKADLAKYSTDESIFAIMPQVVIIPKNRRDVEIAVGVIAHETKRFTSLSLTARAAGTGLSGGSLTDSIVIDTCPHLNHIGEVVQKSGTITITCEPGAMWRDVEKKLKRIDAYIPSYTSSKDICTIGGAVANNAAGPDSLRYGHCADWVESLEVVLADGHTYTIKPLTLREYKLLSKEKHLHAQIAKAIFALIETNEAAILAGKPPTPKNTAGYALWRVFSDGVEAFKKGIGTFDLTRLISGSQGTIGIVTEVTMRALPIQHDTTMLAIPIFDLQDAASVIMKTIPFNPINVEIFDALTFDMALKNPTFFKQRLDGLTYYRVMLAMYATYHVRWSRKVPEFTILVTLDKETAAQYSHTELAAAMSGGGARARVVKNPYEIEMYLQIRRASYTLSKLLDPGKRPAAFLEDMTVPPESMGKFFMEIKNLLKEFNVTSAVHGHGANGHFHFYPLLDFTNPTTPLLVERMAEKFYSTAIKYKGNICGEHNDGIIRTPFLHKLFSPKMLDLFKQAEHIFDPDDIFNPGKKVNPRFDIKTSMRKVN